MRPDPHRPLTPWLDRILWLAFAVLLIGWFALIFMEEAHGQEAPRASDPLSLCQQELAGWRQLGAGQTQIMQVENQKLLMQLDGLKKQVADLEAKAKPPTPAAPEKK